jgi:hypothetical protein
MRAYLLFIILWFISPILLAEDHRHEQLSKGVIESIDLEDRRIVILGKAFTLNDKLQVTDNDTYTVDRGALKSGQLITYSELQPNHISSIKIITPLPAILNQH